MRVLIMEAGVDRCRRRQQRGVAQRGRQGARRGEEAAMIPRRRARRLLLLERQTHLNLLPWMNPTRMRSHLEDELSLRTMMTRTTQSTVDTGVRRKKQR